MDKKIKLISGLGAIKIVKKPNNNFTEFNKNEIYKNIYLHPLVKDFTLVLNNINFDFDKYDLRPESIKELEKILNIMNENPKIIVEISAHTDDRGSEEYNSQLSQQRANSVVQYLISKNIDKNRLTAKGYGFKKPKVPNDSEYNRFLNRRVEFRILQ